MPPANATTGKMIPAGLLTWVLPGLGHWWLGHRALGVVFFLAISFPYFTGLAVGGIKNSVNPWSNHWLFFAEMGCGGYTTGALVVNRNVGELDPRLLADPKFLNSPRLTDEQRTRYAKYLSFYPESDVAQIYLAAAGLLNVLAILDAIARAQTGGLPTFRRELKEAAKSEGGAA